MLDPEFSINFRIVSVLILSSNFSGLIKLKQAKLAVLFIKSKALITF